MIWLLGLLVLVLALLALGWRLFAGVPARAQPCVHLSNGEAALLEAAAATLLPAIPGEIGRAHV